MNVLPKDVAEAIRWYLDTSQHNTDETGCCRDCDACHMEQTVWKPVWQAGRNLMEEVAIKYAVRKETTETYEALYNDAQLYRNRRFMTITNSLSAMGVMAMNPEYLKPLFDEYDEVSRTLAPLKDDESDW